MPFGAEAFTDSVQCYKAKGEGKESPMPFGGGAFTDVVRSSFSSPVRSRGHQCLSARGFYRPGALPMNLVTGKA